MYIVQRTILYAYHHPDDDDDDDDYDDNDDNELILCDRACYNEVVI